jgi:hypothetical protein
LKGAFQALVLHVSNATAKLVAWPFYWAVSCHIAVCAPSVHCRGCVFQVLPELIPGHAARADSAAYVKQRDSWPCCPAVAGFLQSSDLLQALQAALDSTSLLLYNEQYIMKPPCSKGSAFGWHYDSQSCGEQQGVHYSPYLSLWVALNDMTAENGCLTVLPGSRASRQHSSSSMREDMKACQLAGQPAQQLLQAPSIEGLEYIKADCSEVLLAQLKRLYKQPQACTAAGAAHGDAITAGCLQDSASNCRHGSNPVGNRLGSDTGRAVGLEVPAGTSVSCKLFSIMLCMLPACVHNRHV